jgi:hypothetical protein
VEKNYRAGDAHQRLDENVDRSEGSRCSGFGRFSLVMPSEWVDEEVRVRVEWRGSGGNSKTRAKDGEGM